MFMLYALWDLFHPLLFLDVQVAAIANTAICLHYWQGLPLAYFPIVVNTGAAPAAVAMMGVLVQTRLQVASSVLKTISSKLAESRSTLTPW